MEWVIDAVNLTSVVRMIRDLNHIHSCTHCIWRCCQTWLFGSCTGNVFPAGVIQTSFLESFHSKAIDSSLDRVSCCYLPGVAVDFAGFEWGCKMVFVLLELTTVTSVACRNLTVEVLFWNLHVSHVRNMPCPLELVRKNVQLAGILGKYYSVTSISELHTRPAKILVWLLFDIL